MGINAMEQPVQLARPVLFEFLSDQIDDVYACYAHLRQAGGVLRDASGVVLVTRFRGVAETINNPRFAFIGRQTFPSIGPAARARLDAAGFLDLLMFQTGDTHRRTRRHLSELFSFARLGHIRMAVEAKATVLLQRLHAGTALDFISVVAATLPIQALMELVGFEEHELSFLVARSRKVAGLLSAAPLNDEAVTDGAAEFESLITWAERLIYDPSRRRDASHPLMGLIQEVPSDDRRALTADLVALLVTGYDTSKAMLGNAVAALLTHHDARGQLVADPNLTTRAAEELIRHDPAGQVVFRHALEDTTIDMHRIAKGEMLALLIGSANRDEEAFPHAESLDFTRQKGRPLSFGVGPHACIGAALAKIQLIAFLNAFAPHLPHIVDSKAPRAKQHGLQRAHESLMIRTSARAA